jgi:hypothetical protein
VDGQNFANNPVAEGDYGYIMAAALDAMRPTAANF